MSERSVVVHVRNEPAADAADGLEALWSECFAAGQFSATSERAVIRVAGGGRDPMLERTAESLLAYLEQSGRWTAVAIEDRDVPPATPALTQPRLKSPSFRYGVALRPQAFGNFDLITVCRPRGDSYLLHSSIMAAQIENLDLTPLERRALWREAIAEAHRLTRSDFGVVCGELVAAQGDNGFFWAASADDLALERLVARAAGAEPSRLPHLRYLARRQAATRAVAAPDADLPVLTGYLASRPRFWLATAGSRILRLAVLLRGDLARVGADSRRIVTAIKRQFGLAPRL